MNKLILSMSILLLCVTSGYSQETNTRARTTTNSGTSASTSKNGSVIEVADGTRIAGELQNSVDVKKAKVGDQVVLKTTQAIKSNGQIVVNKGAHLFGRITEASQKTKTNGESRLGILFDHLESNSLEVPIMASIVSVVSGHAGARDNQDLFGSEVGSSSSGGARSTVSGQSGAQGGGSLLGGVTSSVGGVVSGATSTTGNVVGSTTSAVGTSINGTTNAVGGVASGTGSHLGQIHISESTDASVGSGSVLSLRGDNLRLEKGTTFNLVLNQSASASKN